VQQEGSKLPRQSRKQQLWRRNMDSACYESGPSMVLTGVSQVRVAPGSVERVSGGT
jgi:hypothetical protein